jgi:glycosyltransferase involved in cell wall biosynthesis
VATLGKFGAALLRYLFDGVPGRAVTTATVDGRKTLSRFELASEAARATLTDELPPEGPLVVICMATHEPPSMLFDKQIESIRRQTHRHFICVISDDASSERGWERIRRTVAEDARFTISRAPNRLGFYGNFERSLRLVPRDANYVALADQDDQWHEDKLEVLVRAIERSDAELAYSDMTIADEAGRTLRTSYWGDRHNASSDLGSLLLMNTVTGAASLFRRDLLDDALPFPPNLGSSYHDHWIACVALARGSIEYVDRPLYAYVQHGANAAGAFVSSPDYRGGVMHALGRLIRSPWSRLRSTFENAGRYADEAARVELFAQTLDLRIAGRVDGRKRVALQRASRLQSPGSVLWLLARSARDLRGRSETLGAELQILKGLAWRLSLLVARRRSKRRG